MNLDTRNKLIKLIADLDEMTGDEKVHEDAYLRIRELKKQKLKELKGYLDWFGVKTVE